MQANTSLLIVGVCVSVLQSALAQVEPGSRRRPPLGKAPGQSDAPRITVTQEGKEPSRPTPGGGPRVTIGGQREGPGPSQPVERAPSVQRDPPRVDVEINPRRFERPPERGGEPSRDPGFREPRVTQPRHVEPVMPRQEPAPAKPKRVEPVAPPSPEPVTPRPVIPPAEPLLRPPRVVTPPPPPMREPQPYQRPAPVDQPVSRSYAPSDGPVLLMENFETQSGGPLPAGWTVVFSGRGASAQGVFSEGGNAFLRVAGRANWSGVLRFDLSESLPPVTEFQCRLRRMGGLNSFGIGNGTRCVCFQLADIGIVDNAWHDVLVGVDFAQGAASCSVDGRLTVHRAAVGEQDSRAKWSWWSTRPAIVLDSGNQGDQALDIDDIVIQAKR